MLKIPLLLVTLAHFMVDTYATLLAPILPLINERLNLNLAFAGLLGTIVSLCNLSQPLMGLWADRMRRRHLVVGGLLLCALFSPLLGLAPTYLSLVAILAAGGMGVAAFHPQSFSLAGELSGERRSFGLALFIFGGTLGLGLTPLWVPYCADRFGLESLALASLPGVAAVLLLLKFAPLDNPQTSRRVLSLRESFNGQGFPLLVITVVVILRSITGLGFGFYLTVLGRERGLSLVAGSIPLGIYNMAGVVGGLVAGYLADRFNPRALVWGSLVLCVPFLYAFLYTGGMSSYLMLVLGGALLLSSNSILVAMAQELAPQSSGLASSLPLGFSWGLASLTLPFVGHLADQIGVAGTLEYLCFLPLPTAALSLLLPGKVPAGK
ncbi:MAG: MFS transporter [Candidatus Latescibacteria bacterium]|nr:MFS transporter [Candidatus Latescibacterota bacterium]